MTATNWIEHAEVVLGESYGIPVRQIDMVAREGVNIVGRAITPSGDVFVKEFGLPQSPEVARRMRTAVDRFAQCGVPVIQVVSDTNGDFLSRHGDRTWQVSRAARGVSAVVLDTDQITSAVTALHRVHMATRLPDLQSSQLAAELAQIDSDYADQIMTIAQRHGVEVDDLVQTRLTELGTRLAVLAKPAAAALLPVSWTHGEVGPSNLLFAGGKLVCMLDFDAASIDSRLVDFGRAAVFLPRVGRGEFGVDPAKLDLVCARFFCDAPPSPTELSCLPLYLLAQFVPRPAYFDVLGTRSPDRLAWYLTWVLSGADYVRNNFSIIRSALERTIHVAS